MSLPEAILQLWPTPVSALLGSSLGFALFFIAGLTAAFCHQRGTRVGDTRKLFHLAIFTGAALLRAIADTGAVVAYGTIVASGVLWSTCLGERSSIFNSLARPSDAPYQRLHVISPMVCTAIGGVLAHLIAGDLATVAYLVAGWGDAVGEPVGIRWGKNRYRVPACGPALAERSWEGSAAVGLASTFAAACALLLAHRPPSEVLPQAIILGLTATVVEALSPHGWDNLTLLVGLACMTRWLS